MNSLPLVRFWVLFSALASIAGWTLSALGHLSRGGYAALGLLVLAGYVLWRKAFPASPNEHAIIDHTRSSAQSGRRKIIRWNKIRWRFGHVLPLGFFLLAGLAFIGGTLYPPSNHTALDYRTPRVLQWLAHGHWFWIHTPNYRMNTRACGFEWLTTPFLLFTKSDRLLFLINFFPFLLLPGLVFSILRRMRVQARVAWCWMWLLPTGYCFLLQAGSLGNDTFPTVYALAAVDFAFRGRTSGRLADLWLSLLAASLLTGAKASNLPLLLPWAILFVPKLALLIRKPLVSLAVFVIGAVISFLPTAILNTIYCGDWSGLTLERAGMDLKNPLVGLWGNPLLLLLNNVVPPLFPLANWWNGHALTLTPTFLTRPLIANFENGFIQLGELQTEDWAGLGFGLTLLVLVSCASSLKAIRSVGKLKFPNTLHIAILISPWLALLAFCLKSGMVNGARLISPYYPLLLPLLLRGNAQSLLVRTRWWRGLAIGTLLLAFVVIVLTPARPLWPARTILSRLQNSGVGPAQVSRALNVYSVYSTRPDPLSNVRASLPQEVHTVGFMADGDDLDISFWRPFFQRKVEHILLSDSGDQIRQRHIDYVIVGGANLEANQVNLADWLTRVGARPIATNFATLKVVEGSQPWFTVKMIHLEH